jgi:hypothetical protein
MHMRLVRVTLRCACLGRRFELRVGFVRHRRRGLERRFGAGVAGGRHKEAGLGETTAWS